MRYGKTVFEMVFGEPFDPQNIRHFNMLACALYLLQEDGAAFDMGFILVKSGLYTDEVSRDQLTAQENIPVALSKDTIDCIQRLRNRLDRRPNDYDELKWLRLLAITRYVCARIIDRNRTDTIVEYMLNFYPAVAQDEDALRLAISLTKF